MKWIIAFLILSILIAFHEFGHFLFAKMAGVDVEEFSIGFGPRILTTVKNGTRYSLKLLLFGGSCQMKGMYEYDDEDEDGDDTPKEPAPPEEGSFQAASLGKRAAIIFAGPLFNFLLAFVGAVVIISLIGYDPAEVVYVQEGSPAAEAGLAEGDTVTEFMGDHISIGRDLSMWFVFNSLTEDSKVTMTYVHEGQKKTVAFDPQVTVRYMMGMTYHVDQPKALIEAVGTDSPLEKAGVAAGDVITGIDGTEITDAQSLNTYFDEHPLTEASVHLTLEREGKSFEADVTPVENRSVSLGFSYNLGRVRTSSFGVLKYSVIELRYLITSTVRSVGALFTGVFGVQDLSGPVGVVDIVGETYEETKSEGALITWMNMINLLILISANLGVMNLLPIPGLDGGRLFFMLFELILRRPVNQKVEMTLQLVAVLALLLLSVYVMYNDILRLLAR
jgi:regulator of sigma E protease